MMSFEKSPQLQEKQWDLKNKKNWENERREWGGDCEWDFQLIEKTWI